MIFSKQKPKFFWRYYKKYTHFHTSRNTDGFNRILVRLFLSGSKFGVERTKTAREQNCLSSIEVDGQKKERL